MSCSFQIETLLRSDIASMETEEPHIPFDVLSQAPGQDSARIVKLDANENPYGPSPGVAQALADAPDLHLYPDHRSTTLRQALADYTGVSAAHLIVGHGAEELIDLTLRLFIEPGDSIVNCPPTFARYAFDGRVHRARLIDVPRHTDFRLNLNAIETAVAEAQSAKLLFACSPNNPDGSLVSDEDLIRLLALPLVVILDEAYAEFAQVSRIDWVTRHPNLIVLRTFSSWAGLAGLRVGYGAFPLAITEHLWQIRRSSNVNVASQLAALVSLQDRAYLLENVGRIIDQRKAFFAQLQSIAWLHPYPSRANFVLCRVAHPQFAAKTIAERLAQEAGILVRHYRTPGLESHLRFSVGTPAQTQQLLDSLRQLTGDSPLRKTKALIFDVDGVLIDVSRSYRESIGQTVQFYFQRGLGLASSTEPLVDTDDIETLKLAGGFNNDRELTAAFIAYFLEMLPPVTVPTFSLRRDVPSMLAYLQMAVYHLDITVDQLRHWKNVARLARQIAQEGGGFAGLKRALDPQNWHLLLSRGAVTNGNLVERIFQELYLGADLFERTYGEPAVVAQTSGFIENEHLIIATEVLAELSTKFYLGIATGRPRTEVEHALRTHGIHFYFESVVSLEDVLEAHAMGKPAPWSLLEAISRFPAKPTESAYVGYIQDDIKAARAANLTAPFKAIGCLAVARDKAATRRALAAQRADFIIDHPNDLRELDL
jgi:histidinol-phosphate aminotransferase